MGKRGCSRVVIGLADASVTEGLQVDLLGPVEVRRAGTVVPVPGRQERRVLALLALHTGERVPAGVLVDLLWGERPPRTAGKTLQAVVSRLRSCLGSPDVIGWRDGGYLLRLPPDAVDALRFRRLAGLGRDRLRADDPGAAADQLRRALSLWRADQRPTWARDPGQPLTTRWSRNGSPRWRTGSRPTSRWDTTMT